MTRRGFIAGSLLVGFAMMPTVIALGSSGRIITSTVKATSKAPAQHCVVHEPATLNALKRGTKYVVVVVKSFQPAKPPVAGLVVWLLSADKTQRHEITRFAVHPMRAFTAQEPARQQRFLVSLAEQATLIKDGQPLCIEVGFDPSSRILEDGTAEIEIEVI